MSKKKIWCKNKTKEVFQKIREDLRNVNSEVYQYLNMAQLYKVGIKEVVRILSSSSYTRFPNHLDVVNSLVFSEMRFRKPKEIPEIEELPPRAALLYNTCLNMWETDDCFRGRFCPEWQKFLTNILLSKNNYKQKTYEIRKCYIDGWNQFLFHEQEYGDFHLTREAIKAIRQRRRKRLYA